MWVLERSKACSEDRVWYSAPLCTLQYIAHTVVAGALTSHPKLVTGKTRNEGNLGDQSGVTPGA